MVSLNLAHPVYLALFLRYDELQTGKPVSYITQYFVAKFEKVKLQIFAQC